MFITFSKNLVSTIREVIKIFNSDSGKLILSNTHSMTKLKGDLIIKKND